MKRLLSAILVLAAAAGLLAGVWYVLNQQRMGRAQRQVATGRRIEFTGPPPPFCVCHSKSPGMRKMHRAFGLGDCGMCHHAENFMRRTKDRKPSRADLKHRRTSNPICLQCHKHPR